MTVIIATDRYVVLCKTPVDIYIDMRCCDADRVWLLDTKDTIY